MKKNNVGFDAFYNFVLFCRLQQRSRGGRYKSLVV